MLIQITFGRRRIVYMTKQRNRENGEAKPQLMWLCLCVANPQIINCSYFDLKYCIWPVVMKFAEGIFLTRFITRVIIF